MASKYFKAGKKVFEFLKPKPKVNKTKLDEAKSNLAKAIQKGKATSAKLKQTQFEIANPQFKGKDFTFATTNKKTLSNTEKTKLRNDESKKAFKASEGKTRVFYPPKNFNKGGRVGLKRGTGLMNKKSDIQKIKETFSPKKSAAKKSTKFGMLSVKAGIDKNPNPTQADRIAGAKMKNKKRFV
jgi:hypothetical protein